MLVLNDGDKILGYSSSSGCVDYTIHGIVGDNLTQISNGQLGTSGTLYSASTAVGISSIVMVNTNATLQTVNLSLLPSGGTARSVIPKDLNLLPSHSLHFEGGKSIIMSPSGNILMAGTSGSSGTSGAPDTRKGSAIINFGTSGTSIPTDEASVDITGISDMTATAHISVFMQDDDTTADNTADDHSSLNYFAKCSASNRVAGVGFTANIKLLGGVALGTYKIHYLFIL